MSVDTYCTLCETVVCPRCAVANHPRGHIFSPLDQVSDGIKDQILGFTVAITKRERRAEQAVDSLRDLVMKIEETRQSTETEILAAFAALHAELDSRQTQLLESFHQKADSQTKTAQHEKDDAERCVIESREFRTFTEGLLAQGTPLEIAGCAKMVSPSLFHPQCQFWSELFPFLHKVKIRHTSLNTVLISTRTAINPKLAFTLGDVTPLKDCIKLIGSVD